jgi:hypothetical protein
MYRDDGLRSVPGAHYPVELSRNLCRSVCMIAILVPEYFESSWCKAEWDAMVKLERERVADPGTGGFIIPILFRGDKEKVAEFCGPRVFLAPLRSSRLGLGSTLSGGISGPSMIARTCG